MNVKNLRTFIELNRALYWLIFIFSTLTFSILLILINSDNEVTIFISPIIIYINSIVSVVSVFLAIGSLFLRLREYDVDGIAVAGYAGWYHHYLIVDGEIVDEHNTFSSFVTIYLDYDSPEHSYDMTISTSNAIRLKVDKKLVTPK